MIDESPVETGTATIDPRHGPSLVLPWCSLFRSTLRSQQAGDNALYLTKSMASSCTENIQLLYGVATSS